MYDDAPRMELSRGVHTVAYADDLAIVATGRTIPELEVTANATIDMVSA